MYGQTDEQTGKSKLEFETPHCECTRIGKLFSLISRALYFETFQII
jgi:hypothetical protein